MKIRHLVFVGAGGFCVYILSLLHLNLQISPVPTDFEIQIQKLTAKIEEIQKRSHLSRVNLECKIRILEAKISQQNFDLNNTDTSSVLSTSTSPSFKIKVHSIEKDIYVSNDIQKYGIWERALTQFISEVLTQFPPQLVKVIAIINLPVFVESYSF
jgi:hypothetical protein